MLLRPILLHVVRYSEYISARDTEPSEFVSKCAFSLLAEERGDWDGQTRATNKCVYGRDILPLQSKFLPIEFHNTSRGLIGLKWSPCGC